MREGLTAITFYLPTEMHTEIKSQKAKTREGVSQYLRSAVARRLEYERQLTDYRQFREHYDAVKEAMGDYLAELSEAGYNRTLLSAFDVMERLQRIMNPVSGAV